MGFIHQKTGVSWANFYSVYTNKTDIFFLYSINVWHLAISTHIPWNTRREISDHDPPMSCPVTWLRSMSNLITTGQKLWKPWGAHTHTHTPTHTQTRARLHVRKDNGLPCSSICPIGDEKWCWSIGRMLLKMWCMCE